MHFKVRALLPVLLALSSLMLKQSLQLAIQAQAELEAEEFMPLSHPNGVDMTKFSYDPARAAKNAAQIEPSPALLTSIRGSKEDYEKMVKKKKNYNLATSSRFLTAESSSAEKQKSPPKSQ